jgi:hypothetical protein
MTGTFTLRGNAGCTPVPRSRPCGRPATRLGPQESARSARRRGRTRSAPHGDRRRPSPARSIRRRRMYADQGLSFIQSSPSLGATATTRPTLPGALPPPTGAGQDLIKTPRRTRGCIVSLPDVFSRNVGTQGRLARARDPLSLSEGDLLDSRVALLTGLDFVAAPPCGLQKKISPAGRSTVPPAFRPCPPSESRRRLSIVTGQ